MNMNFNLNKNIVLLLDWISYFTWIVSAWINGVNERLVRAIGWDILIDKNESNPLGFVENGSIASKYEPLEGHSIWSCWSFYTNI